MQPLPVLLCWAEFIPAIGLAMTVVLHTLCTVIGMIGQCSRVKLSNDCTVVLDKLSLLLVYSAKYYFQVER